MWLSPHHAEVSDRPHIFPCALTGSKTFPMETHSQRMREQSMRRCRSEWTAHGQQSGQLHGGFLEISQAAHNQGHGNRGLVTGIAFKSLSIVTQITVRISCCRHLGACTQPIIHDWLHRMFDWAKLACMRAQVLGTTAVTARALMENPSAIDWGLLPKVTWGLTCGLCACYMCLCHGMSWPLLPQSAPQCPPSLP